MADKETTLTLTPNDIAGALQRWCRQLDMMLESGAGTPKDIQGILIHMYGLNDQLIKMMPADGAEQKSAAN